MPSFDYNSKSAQKLIRTLIREVGLFGIREDPTEEDEKFVEAIVAKLDPKEYASGDYVVKKDDLGTCMIFVLHGRMAMVYEDRQREICDEDGYSFGENSLIYETKRTASIRATTDCAAYILNKSAFEDVIEDFPKRIRIIEAVMKRQDEDKKRRQQEQENQRKQEREQAKAGRRANEDDLEDLEAQVKNLEAEIAEKEMGDGRDCCTFSNGDEYDGEWKDMKMHGQGTYTYAKTGNVYDGQWVNNKKHGVGHMVYKQTGNEYRGEWVNNAKHGKGVAQDSARNRYEGEFKDGKMSGKGRYEYANGNLYVGEFGSNEFHGRGVFSYHNGDRYDGEWHEGAQHGKGVLTTFENHVYDGEWVNDHKHGKGVYKGDDYQYEGEWRDGRMHGHGTLRYTSGEEYVGDWKFDDEDGRGKWTHPDGSAYEGEWKGGNRHGKGRETLLDGEGYDGEWRDNDRHGSGLYTYASGASYDGEWSRGVMHGVGTYTYRSGKKYKVYYSDGKLTKKEPLADGVNDPARPGTASQQYDPWLRELPVDNSIKDLLIKERVDEKTFYSLDDDDLKELKIPLGPRKMLKQLIAKKE